MPVDLKLVEWIKANHARLTRSVDGNRPPSYPILPMEEKMKGKTKIEGLLVHTPRAQIIEQLKPQGNAEQDIVDSCDEVVQRSGKPMAATVIRTLVFTFSPSARHELDNLEMDAKSEGLAISDI